MPDPLDRLSVRERIDAARVEVEANLKRLEESRSRLAATREEVASGRLARERLHMSAFARLHAKLDSLPVIEQAKGILMAQCGWSDDQAFDALRRLSQRENIKLRDLAAKVVATTAHAASAQSHSRDRRRPGVAAQDRARRA